MTLGLTNLEIKPLRGNAALLPNQPILQGCKVASSETATLVPGDIVTLATSGGSGDVIVVKKAGTTDLPFGVVAGCGVKTGFKAKENVSVFPVNSYVYMEAADATIARGTVCQFDANGKLKKTNTSSNGEIGIALTAGVSAGDILIVQVKPGITA